MFFSEEKKSILSVPIRDSNTNLNIRHKEKKLENDEQNESDIIEKGNMSAVKFKDELRDLERSQRDRQFITTIITDLFIIKYFITIAFTFNN